MKATTVGIDLAKNVFQVHGVNEYGKVRSVECYSSLASTVSAYSISVSPNFKLSNRPVRIRMPVAVGGVQSR